jgi:hypothetical protein
MTGYKKMKTKILAVAILLFTSLTPMAWSHVITQSDLNQIRVGQTTEADLFQLFGAPTTRSVDLRHQVTLDWFRSKPMPWQGYIPFIGAALGGLDIEAQQVTVVLTPGGRVLRFEAHSSENTIRGMMPPPTKRWAQSSN